MKDYTCYTKEEAINSIPKFNHLIGSEFIGHYTKRKYKVVYILVVPANPDKQNELGVLMSKYSRGVIPIEDIYEFEKRYTDDEFAIAIYATTIEGFPSLFHLLPIQAVVNMHGVLEDGFGI